MGNKNQTRLEMASQKIEYLVMENALDKAIIRLTSYMDISDNSKLKIYRNLIKESLLEESREDIKKCLLSLQSEKEM